MSIYNSQEYTDAWDDMPSSLQEQLLQDVALLESGTVLTSTATDQPLLSHDTRNTKKQKRYHDEQSQLKVYRDPLLTTTPIPEMQQTNTAKAKAQLLDRTNQQHLQQNDSTELFEKKRCLSPPPPTHQQESVIEPNSSDTDIIDDDDMWLEFDDTDIPALLEDMENNHRNTSSTMTHNPLANGVNDNDNDGMIPTAAAATTPSLAQLDKALQKFGGFQTAGSRKDIKPNDSALKAAHDKALALLAEPIPSTPTVSSSNSPTMPKSPTPPPPQTCDLATSTLENSAPSFTSGFSTARGTKLKEPSLEAKRKAQRLILASPTRPSPPHRSIHTASYSSDSHPPPVLADMTSFTTESSHANDTKSIEQNMDTEKLVQTPPILSTSTSSLSISSDALNKDPFQLSAATTEQSIYQYEDVLQQFGGFSKASGKKVDTVISEAAKQQALALFTADTASTQLTQPSSSSQGRPSSQPEAESSTASMQSSTAASLVDTSTTEPPISSPPTTDQQLKDTNADLSSAPSSSLSISPSPPTTSTVAAKAPAPFKRRIHTQKDHKRPRSKPFKSPAVNLDLIRAGLEKRASTTGLIRTKGPSVFDMHPVGCRRPLSSLGQPHRYTKETLISMNVSATLIDMTPCKARSFMFANNWGVRDAEKELIAAGALSSMIPNGWTENHYGWIVWKLAKRLCLFPHYALNDGGDYWSREHVMNQLLYRYEREINLGQRPVLRRIMEQDDVAVKQMVLMVADIVCLTSSSSSCNSNTYRLQLTDGWYQISTCVDSKMNSMISQGRVYIGQKLSITGAQLTGDFTPKTPLEALTMARPDSSSPHDVTSTTLMISSNSCLPCAWDSTLGYPRRRLRRQVIRLLNTNIYENGGLITMMEVVICKKYPMMYSETMDNGMVVNRNAKDEDDYRRPLDQQAWSSSNSQDRRVSGHFRLRICDTNKPGGGRSTVVATLLVTNTLEIMHMDLVEGRQYRLYFVQPYQPRNKTLDGPSLITTRLTKWEPLKSPTLKASSLDHQPYPLRSICMCADIKDLTMADVDMAVLVLHTQPATSQQYIDGRKAWYSTLLVTDTSLALCQITCRSFYRPVQDMKGQILGLMNVRFMLYDAKCDIIHIKSSNETEIWTNPTGAMGFMQHAMKGLKQWTESEPSGLAAMHQRVKDLIQT